MADGLASPRRLKILHVLHAFSAGGLENGVVNIINGSPEHLTHELCFLTQGGDFLSRLNRPVRTHEMHKRPGNDPALVWKIQRLIRKSQADIVHTRNWASFDGVLAACVTPGVRLIHGEHGRDIADPQGLNRKRNMLRRFFRFRVSRYVAVSADLHRWLHETVRIPVRKLVCIPNGVDSDRFQPVQNSALRKELGIGNHEFVVGTIGRLDPVKNHLGLIQAVEQLNRSGAPVRLIIVGDGPERRNLEERVGRCQSEPRPILAGYRSDVAAFYGVFDAFALNSHAEGMSNTLLEAMSSGLAVVCTAVGGNVELVLDGVRGSTIPANDDDALIRRIQDYRLSSHLRLEHGRNAREFIQRQFSLKAMIQNYLELYQSTPGSTREGSRFHFAVSQ